MCTKIECLIHLNAANSKKDINDCVDMINKIISLVDEKLKEMYISMLEKAVSSRRVFLKEEKNKVFIETNCFISDAISWNYNEKYGNHSIANRDISVGEHIIIEKFYSSFPMPSKTYTTCTNCLNLITRSIPCDSCPFVVFCSNDCKNEAWKEFHEIECKLYPVLYPYCNKDLTRIYLFSMRLFIKILKEKGVRGLIDDVDKLDKKIGNFLN